MIVMSLKALFPRSACAIHIMAFLLYSWHLEWSISRLVYICFLGQGDGVLHILLELEKDDGECRENSLRFSSRLSCNLIKVCL
jgi:hypothetical protein